MRLADHVRSAPFRIAAIYAAVFVASVLLIFGITYWSISREMSIELRDAIEQDMRPLVSAYAEGRLDRLVQAARERAAAAEPGNSYYLLISPDGTVLAGNMPALPPFEGWRRLTLATEAVSPGQPGTGAEVDTIVGLGVRLDHAFAFVGRSTARIRQTQQLILRSLGWAVIGTLLLSLAGGVLLSRGALRRVEGINRTVQAIMAGDLSKRLPVGRTDDEMNRLAVNVNEMLDRIAELMESLRQVTNDIAHDLRTPLGRLRQRLESARLREVDVEGYRHATDDAIEQIGAILDTFNALLRIAQIEAGARRANFIEVDLSEVLQTITEVYETVAEEEGQELVAEIAPGSGLGLALVKAVADLHDAGLELADRDPGAAPPGLRVTLRFPAA
jgi:signal transduction histidine kinase